MGYDEHTRERRREQGRGLLQPCVVPEAGPVKTLKADCWAPGQVDRPGNSEGILVKHACNLVNTNVTSVMLTEEYIVMLLITVDLALLSLYVVTIWFVQRKIRNLSPNIYHCQGEIQHEKHRNAQLRYRPRPRRIRRNLHDFIGKDDQRISDQDQRTGSGECCDDSDPSLRTWKHMRHGLISR